MQTSYKNLLYIDDEVESLNTFKSAFRKDYKIYTGISAEEGINILGEHEIHLIITDQRMPGKSGVEFLEEINPQYPEIPKIILTGYSDIDVIAEAVNKVNLFQYVSKPWVKEDFQYRIDKALELYFLKIKNKELIQDLTSANHELDGIFSRISSDLKPPAASIRGLILTALRDNLDKLSKHYLEQINIQFDPFYRVLDKLSQLRVINQYSSDQQRIHFDEMLQELQHDFKTDLQDKDIAFNIDIADDIDFHGEKMILRIILENLVENSILFSNQDDKYRSFIKIDIKEDDKNLVLIVEDNGEGIRSAAIPRIFDIFYKDSQRSKGDGIGLYVVRKATAIMGGIIDVVTQKGTGTSIEIKFPKRNDG
ncbi:hybrid sensor histidine kinase/response regulator [Bacteroidota bacterium]